jgi:RAB protein geranylgeranyltransferase component A
VSAQAETDNPETELKPGIDLLGAVDELFIDTYDRYEPTNDSSSDNCYISTVSFAEVKSMLLQCITLTYLQSAFTEL